MKCPELVIQDHRIIRCGLDILDGMVNQIEDGVRIEIADAMTLLKVLRLYGEEHSQTIKESDLFAGIEDAIKAKQGVNFVRTSRRLCLLLRNHLKEEDSVLCNLAERRIQPDTQATLFRLERKYIQQPHTNALNSSHDLARGAATYK